MKNEDIKQLAVVMKSTAKLYSKDVDSSLVDIYFDLLIDFTMDEISKAFKDHVMTGESKDFYPKPGNISDLIRGKEITFKPDDIIALALSKKTPLGVFAAAFIGSYDMGNGNTIYLRGRAKEFLLDLDELTNRSNTGTYSPWEMQLLDKYNIDPLSPLAPGLKKPRVKESKLRLVDKKTVNGDDFDSDIPI